MAGYITQAPSNFTPDAADIQRQQQLAQMLQQQAMAPMGGTEYAPGGVAIRRSPVEGLAKMLQAYIGKQQADKADAMRRDMQAAGVKDVQGFIQALRGSPAAPTGQTFESGANEMGDEAATQRQWSPAQSADPQKALALALGSQNPMLQNAGGALLSQQIASMTPKPPKWEKYEMPDGRGGMTSGFVDVNSPNPIATFQRGGSQPAKMEFVNTGGTTTPMNPYVGGPAGAAIPHAAPPANPAADLVLPGPDGRMVPNLPLVGVKKDIGKASASNVNVKVDNKLGEGLAAQVGPMIAASHGSAVGAQQSIANAEGIIKAVDSGKVLAGPGATFRLRGLQLGDAMGVNGADAREKLQNTRTAIQGLAQSTIAARKQLAGQGQVSDYEGKLLERASSGNIDDMTGTEIRQIAEVNKRLAKRQIEVHKQLLDKTKANPTTAPIAGFFDLPSEDAPGLKFNPKTGKIE